ncbi:MAG: hypothetical protein JSS07_10135 [Proteobacteria bacterium]|nr:hypothetical protein [Pseudomonadota bacterium]
MRKLTMLKPKRNYLDAFVTFFVQRKKLKSLKYKKLGSIDENQPMGEAELIEKDLRQFKQALAKLKLYHKDRKLMLEIFDESLYYHPLLKHSSKLIQQLCFDLFKNEGFEQPSVLHDNVLPEIHTLSSKLSTYCQKIVHDFSGAYLELSKLRDLFTEQKNLSQNYVQPLGKVFLTTEQTLLKTPAYSSSISQTLQQLHEIQTVLSHLKTLMTRLIAPSGEKQNIIFDNYQEIIALLSRITNALSDNKLKLQDVLTHFEDTHISSKQVKDHLNASLHARIGMEQATKRGYQLSNAAYDNFQVIQDRMDQLQAFVKEIQHKSSLAVACWYPIATTSEMNEQKKKAEDVLFEEFIT